MREVRRGSAHTNKHAILIACALSILVVGAARPALADDGEVDGCCVCDCTEKATTAGGPQPGPGAICFDVPSTVSCGDLCVPEGCGQDFFQPIACSELAGCPQANPRMAPAASPLVLAAIGLALAILGVRATRKSG